jgi:hypothetical protein
MERTNYSDFVCKFPPLPVAHQKRHNLSLIAACLPASPLPPNRPATPEARGGIAFRRHEVLQPYRRDFSGGPSNEPFAESPIDAFTGSLSAGDGSEPYQSLMDTIEDSEEHFQFRAQLSRNARKAQRQSRPATVLAAIRGPTRELYFIAPSGKTDLSYVKSRSTRRQNPKAADSLKASTQLPEPASLYSILARYLEHHTDTRMVDSEFRYTSLELGVLGSQGYTPQDVGQWASCLVESRSNVAAKIFELGTGRPPLFLLLLFLRRKHIRVFALGIVIRHLIYRAKVESISWAALKIIVIRLLRHTRELWPESMPWIASFFTTEARRLHDDEGGANPISHRSLSDVTQFCNNYLMLISLPATARPVVFASHQEKAQFQILQYMASSSPAIVVTSLGFRSVTRNQLAHAKTPQEREWAELKGPSWPPWKENRTAMDEDKGYEFGASRASKILHRMYEAGYGGRIWEDMAQVYAGWDTDSSPTIQTRTSLPRFSHQYRDSAYLRSLLWAGRIRTTRTRREAWACFLSQESSGEAAHPNIYLAMFEKIYYRQVERSDRPDFPSDSAQGSAERDNTLLPGDMKEVSPDSPSSLHQVYISEPVPIYPQLLRRMFAANIKPSNRLLAFLLDTCNDFEMGLDLLAMAKNAFNGGVGRILAGIHDDNDTTVQSIPGYLFASIIQFLCRFGHFDQPPPRKLVFLPPDEHMFQLKLNRQYVVEYAHMLLQYYRPRYRPAWAALVAVLVQHKGSEQAGNTARYRLICDMLEQMEEIDLDVDGEIFRLACTVTIYAAQTVNQGAASIEDARHLFYTGSARLRTLFYGLVGANADMQSSTTDQDAGTIVPPHIPGPAELHTYVRALGILRDYEGLYSFSTWLTKHHTGVTARAEAQRSGSQILFRTLVALRLAVDGGRLSSGLNYAPDAPEDIALLIKQQIDGVEEWGGWPAQEYVDMYAKGHLKTAMPTVGGR